KMLLLMMREYVPDEKRPFSDPSILSFVVSTVRTNKLLSEQASLPVQHDSIDAWKSAVDSWVHRMLGLASSNLPENCWAGICLLGFTCQECDAERFLASYSVWLHQLLSNIQDDALTLLCTLIFLFPTSVYHHYEAVEAALVSNIMYGECSGILSEKLGYALSMLPKLKGDDSSWLLMMDKILFVINNQLTDAFQGLEEEDRSAHTMRALLPAGKEAPPPLCGLTASEESRVSARRPERLLGSRTSTLILCCCNMLINSYSVEVSVPVCGLIALAERVLMVQVPSSPSSSTFMTLLKQDLIIPEIPILQLQSLTILISLIKGVGSQLLPHVSSAVRLLNGYLMRCKFFDLRGTAFSTLKGVLISMGVGVAIHISQDVINHVSADFDSSRKDDETSVLRSCITELSNGSHHRKKRKLSPSFGPDFRCQNGSSDAVVSQHSIPVSVKIACLELLEFLLIVGGSMRSERWRRGVDKLLMDAATSAPVSEAFQLAALRALVVSLVSPTRTGPSHLPLALNLFLEGMRRRGTKVSELCRRALMALEPVMHPRALPVFDDLHPGWEAPDLIHVERSRKERVDDDDDDDDDDEREFDEGEDDKPLENGVESEDHPARDPVVVVAAGCEQRAEDMVTEEMGIVGVSVENKEKSEAVEAVSAAEAASDGGVVAAEKDKDGGSAAAILDRISATLQNVGGSLVEETDDLLPDIVDGDPDSD
ncbi:hypothetical protein M569_12425, partial [Genlisea aurea]